MNDYGIRTVIDLRFPGEVAGEPHPFRVGAQATEGPRYLNLPLRYELDAARTTAETYRVSLDRCQVGLARIVRAIAHAPGGGVVVHCNAGKDRTGLVVALLLTLVGVPEQVIAQDYALSFPNLRSDNERRLAEGGPRDPAERARLRQGWRSDPETMEATLAYLVERHGGAREFLLAGGATSADLGRIRERLMAQLYSAEQDD